MKKKKQDVKIESCMDEECWIHGSLRVRGRIFKGYVVRKFPRRIAIEFERVVYVKKYERYIKKKTRIHARLPKCMENSVNIGDYVRVGECRPLSNIIHFVVIEVVKKKEQSKESEEDGK